MPSKAAILNTYCHCSCGVRAVIWHLGFQPLTEEHDAHGRDVVVRDAHMLLLLRTRAAPSCLIYDHHVQLVSNDNIAIHRLVAILLILHPLSI